MIIVSTALFGVYGFLFYRIKTASEETSTLSYELNARQTNEDDLTQLRHAVNDMKEDRMKLQSYFVRSSSINTFFDSLESLGAESNVVVKLGGLIERESLLGIDVGVSGTFEDIYYFVKLIEHLPYRIEFKKAFFSSSNISAISLPVVEHSQPESLSGGESVEGEKNETRKVLWDASFTLEISGYIKE